MIEEITIKNLGVIEYSQVNFAPQMTVISGETGSGKTMALTSLLLLLGQKSDASKIREGAQRAIVEGIFRVDLSSPALAIVSECGGEFDIEDDSAILVIARHLLNNGRSRAYIGGVSVPVNTLKQLSPFLFSVHGQSEQLRLSSKAEHLTQLDNFADLASTIVFAAYNSAWQEYKIAQTELAHGQANAQNLGTEKLALEALVQQVEAVDPQIGEDDQLRAESLRLENVEEIRAALHIALTNLDGDEELAGAISQVANAEKELERAADPSLNQLAQTLEQAQLVMAEVRSELLDALSSLNTDPQRLHEVHARRAELTALERKLSMDIPTMREKAAWAKQRLTELADPHTYIEQLKEKEQLAYAKVQEIGAELRSLRTQAAQELAQQVTVELQELAMPDARFAVQVSPAPEPNSRGLDEVEFLLAPHLGSSFNKITATASGGELSRVMLAIEVALAARANLTGHTFIFDEVDAGIGGKTALAVGARLAKLSASAQVITVTHLAQVAAYAHHHILVSKETRADHTVTSVVTLNKAERELELARMLSGNVESEVARIHAAELLAEVGSV